tara:strand:- start:1360 stop:3111 length:1752 start_codon:yes stop_codon:yes gene_type:complete
MPVELFGFTIGRTNQPKKSLQSFAKPEYEDGALPVSSGGVYGTYVDTDATIKTEFELVNRYRDMALQAECEAAIDDIVNEAIVTSHEVPPARINIDNVNISDNIKEKIRTEFSEIIRLLDFNKKGVDIFKRWYIDGRCYYHVVIDEKQPKRGIQELRVLDPRKIKKVRESKKKEGNTATIPYPSQQSETREFFVYNEKGLYRGQGGASYQTSFGQAAAGIRIAPDAIIYNHSGLLNSSRSMILSYLHKAIKPLNQLRMLEDAMVIYRIARAPERRIFYIDVGNLPKLKAEQYLRDLMTKYRNKLVYDSNTGEIRDDRKHMSMLEDYWLPRREGGRGTEITTLPGGQNLGDIEDILYFQKKLYKSLSVPISRLESEANYTIGRATEISRDEVKFTRFVNKLQTQFSGLFNDCLERQLTLKGILSLEDWKMIKTDIFYVYENDSHFAEMKNAELMQDRMNLLRDLSDYAGKYYSHDFIRKYILRQTDDQIREIDDAISSELEDPRYNRDEEGASGGAPMYNEVQPNDNKKMILEDIDKKLEVKFENAKKEKELKDTVSDVFNSILEDDEEDLKDTLNEVFNSVRK